MTRLSEKTALEIGKVIERGLVTEEMGQDLLAKAGNPILTLLHTDVPIDPTCGSETIAKAKETFPGFIDSNFVEWDIDKNGGAAATDAARVKVYEMNPEKRAKATFAEMFESLGEPDELVLTQGQIIGFCEQHRDLLRSDGCATFFLFRVGDESFVAHVRVDSDGLRVYVDRFGLDYRWYAVSRHRLVAPQL